MRPLRPAPSVRFPGDVFRTSDFRTRFPDITSAVSGAKWTHLARVGKTVGYPTYLLIGPSSCLGGFATFRFRAGDRRSRRSANGMNWPRADRRHAAWPHTLRVRLPRMD